MTASEARARLHVLAGELPALTEAEQRAAEALAEARLALEEAKGKCTGKGDFQAAANAYAQADRYHLAAARALENNLRRAGLLRRLLEHEVKA